MTKELPSRIEDAIIEDAIYSLNIALEVLTTFLNDNELLSRIEDAINNLNIALEVLTTFLNENEDEEVINLFHFRRIILLEQPLLDEVIYNVEKLDLGLSDDQMDQLLENIENSLLRKNFAGVAQ